MKKEKEKKDPIFEALKRVILGRISYGLYENKVMSFDAEEIMQEDFNCDRKKFSPFDFCNAMVRYRGDPSIILDDYSVEIETLMEEIREKFEDVLRGMK